METPTPTKWSNLIIGVYTDAAKNGNTDVMIILAKYYISIENNHEEGLKYLKMARDNGDAKGMHYLGLYYNDTNDKEESIKHFIMASDKGCTSSMYRLEKHYYEEKNYENAIKYAKMILDVSNNSTTVVATTDIIITPDIVNNTMYHLANYYFLLNDEKEGEKYYILAANNGDVNSMEELASYYSSNKKYEESEKYYIMAIENNSFISLSNLGNLYNLTKKYDLGIKYLHKAFDEYKSLTEITKITEIQQIQQKLKLNIASMILLELGDCYRNKCNYELSEKYYKLSIEEDNTNGKSMERLGYHYTYIEQNYDLANSYYKSAIENNEYKSLFHIGNFRWMILDDCQNDECIEYYEKAIEKNIPIAYFHLGLYYHTQKQNYDLAIKNYKLSIENNEFIDVATFLLNFCSDEINEKYRLIIKYHLHITKETLQQLSIEIPESNIAIELKTETQSGVKILMDNANTDNNYYINTANCKKDPLCTNINNNSRTQIEDESYGAFSFFSVKKAITQ